MSSGGADDESLKYHRVEGKLTETIKSDRITCLSISEESIVLGTDDGFVHITKLSGDIIKSFKAHDRAVNDVSIDNAGTTIASCSDNGTVVLQYLGSDGEKETMVHLNEPVKCVCVEDDNNKVRDRSFLVGCSSGQLIHHKQVWFTQKKIVLFNGAKSPVTSIAWNGHTVAWADSDQVRLMDISSQTAICFLSSPIGVSALNPYPCKLFWESESDLLIGWADNFRHLQLVHTSQNGPESAGDTGGSLFAKTIADWQSDVIICGLTSFDANHILLLGYVPPNADTEMGDFPEVQIIKKSTGELVSVDALPVVGDMPRGPWSYHLVSNYTCFSRRRDLHRWNLTQSRSTRGGNKGLSPTCFMSSGQDFVVIRVRDINDRVHSALELGDLKSAVCLAFSDRTSLRQYQLHDLLTLYLEDLLDKGHADIAALECHALIGKDSLLWERWVLSFVSRKQLAAITPYIPVANPRLPSSVYEVALEEFLQTDTKLFLAAIVNWAKVEPRLFDHNMLLLRLETAHKPDQYCIEAEAELYMISKQYDKAISAYLEIEGERCKDVNKNTSSSGSAKEKRSDARDFTHIFDLIERENLFDVVRDKLVNMFRLSREHTEQFLLRNLEKLPVKVVVKQLRNDRKSLCCYLHLIFTNCFDTYNTQEFADYHIMQVSLYTEFAHLALVNGSDSRCDKSGVMKKVANSNDITSGYDLVKETQAEDNDFLKFLKTSSFVPLPLALQECEKRDPPLFHEMVYILARMDAKRDALGLLLREIGSAQEAIRFVESQHDRQLWQDLVEYRQDPSHLTCMSCIHALTTIHRYLSLNNVQFLSQLLDFLGVCNLDPYVIISRIPAKLSIPKIQNKMRQIVDQYDFQVFLNDICNDILEFDALHLLRRLNQCQRRAIRVAPQQLRCRICTRPLYLSHGAIPTDAASLSLLHRLKAELFQVWGSASHTEESGVILFSNIASFHRYCFVELFGEEAKKASDDEGDVDGTSVNS